jgi:long-subunit fatty acid transport protein
MLLNYNRSLTSKFLRTQRMVLLSLVLLCVAVALMPSQALAQAKVGTTGAQFLELGVSARAMGMAEAYTAVANDITAVYYNPAGLTSLYGREAALTYIDMPADVGFGFGAYAMPLESIGGVLGVSFYHLTSGEMIERTWSRGTQAGTGRTFGWNDVALGVSYGRYLTDRFSLGFSVKFVGQFVHEYSASGWSADVGTMYDTGHRGFKIAMVITNFGPDLTMISQSYPLPINFKFGGSINLVEQTDHLVTFAAEGSHPSDNLEKYNTGLEYTFKSRFSLRAGHRFNYDEDGFTAGGGLMVPFGEESEIRVDYAFQDFGILTQVHRFSLAFAF